MACQERKRAVQGKAIIRRLGTERKARRRSRGLFFESLEDRRLLTTFTWIGAGGDGNWGTTANWSDGVAPTGSTHTLIFSTANVTGTHTRTNNDIAGLTDITVQVTDSSTTANFTLAGNDLGLSAVGLSHTSGAVADNTTVSLGLTGAGGIVTSAGSGRLTLSGASSYGGGTSVNAGQVNVQNGSALGTGAVAVAGGAVLELQNNITVTGVPLTLSPSQPGRHPAEHQRRQRLDRIGQHGATQLHQRRRGQPDPQRHGDGGRAIRERRRRHA